MTNQRPSLARIGETQNSDENLRRRLAATRFYTNAGRLYFGGASLTILLALISPLVLLFWSDLGPYLGAVAGVWIFASRLVLDPFKRRFQLKGATAQELFDCAVLGVGWNDALASRLSHEEVRAASRSDKGREKARDWYPAVGDAPWPLSVLICQRANTVWARRQHGAYALAVAAAAGVWAVVGIVVALLDSATLGQYLVTIALPSLPAFLDASDVYRGHAAASASRELLEKKTDALLASDGASPQDLREIQDQLFNLRTEAPLVPQWFYKAIRSRFEEDMRYAAEQTAKEQSAAVRSPGESSDGENR